MSLWATHGRIKVPYRDERNGETLDSQVTTIGVATSRGELLRLWISGEYHDARVNITLEEAKLLADILTAAIRHAVS